MLLYLGFFSTFFLLGPWWPFKMTSYKSSVNFFPPNRCPYVWCSIFGFVQGSHFICLHFRGDLDHGYSTVCEEVGILVWRCKSFFHDQIRPTYLENLLVDWPMNIGMRAIEHVIPNCSNGNHRYLKCVANNVDSFMATKLWTEPSTFAANYALISAMFYSTLWWVVMDSVWQ